MVTGFFDGGAGGIRTHEPVRTTWFRVRPVMTTSIPLPICSAAVFPRLFPMKKGFGKNWRKEQQTYSIFEPWKTRTVTRFLVDETDSSPQDFESAPLWPLRYLSMYKYSILLQIVRSRIMLVTVIFETAFIIIHDYRGVSTHFFLVKAYSGYIAAKQFSCSCICSG